MSTATRLVVVCMITPTPGVIPYVNVPKRFRDRVFGEHAQSTRVVIVVEDTPRHHATYEKLELIQTPIRSLLVDLRGSSGIDRIRDLAPGENPEQSTLLICIGKNDYCGKFVDFCVNGFNSAKTGWVAKLGNVVTGAQTGEVIWIEPMRPQQITCVVVSDLFA